MFDFCISGTGLGKGRIFSHGSTERQASDGIVLSLGASSQACVAAWLTAGNARCVKDAPSQPRPLVNPRDAASKSPRGQKVSANLHTFVEGRESMPRLNRGVPMKYCLLWLLFSLVANFTWAQSETATVSGQVVDPSGLSVTGAQVKLVDIDRDTTTSATTNNSGLYTFPSVRPGRYRMEVNAAGFKVVNVTGLTLNVQDHLEQNFRLQLGSVAESRHGRRPSAQQVNTRIATVSTVVDRNFAENLPMNGRSFQSLIQLTPGVVLTANNGVRHRPVQCQRTARELKLLDGGRGERKYRDQRKRNPGSGLAGTLGSTSVFGGTNSLVSVDALQEFRIQTSTYAPEFGRQPGAQISIVTRSGTNQFHGTAFDYFRNDASRRE